jgi:hypothetical protein
MNLRGKFIPKFGCYHFTVLFLTVIFTFCLIKPAQSQTINKIVADTTLIYKDSLSLNDTLGIDDSLTISDTVVSDSLRKAKLDSLGIRISKDALPDIVTATAVDSAVLNMKEHLFYLYGNAQVNYQDLQLNAGKITFDQSQSVVLAQPAFDSLGIAKERPSFTQGSEKFTYDSLQYNFKSKRAIVRNARTQYGEGFVFSEQVKRNPDQSLYGLHNIYTTCSLDTPHYGIKAQKIKVVPNQVIASGPANITVEDVPTPLFLPFGLFPIAQGHKSGFRLPSYTIEENRGLGLIDGGYYFYINDYVDLLLTTRFYSRGSWAASGISTYANRYRYNGGLSFSYAYNKTGEVYERNSSIGKDFNINWNHRSDPKSRPGVTFSASVNAGTSTFYSNNSYNIQQILQNQFQSNISYQKAWLTKPYTLTVSARHSQNTQTREVDVYLPEVAFFTPFNPFQGPNSTGTKWYEKITGTYSFSGLNRYRFIDSNFSLNQVSLNDMNHDMVHTIPLNATYNVMRYFKLDFNTSYNEYWLTRQTYRYFNPEFEKEDTIRRDGFYTARDFSAGVNLNTKIYGIRNFRNSGLAGIFHVIIPRIGFSYTPDFAASPFRYGYRTITAGGRTPVYISPYEQSVAGVPGRGQFGDFNSSLNFGIDNNLQIKVRTNDSIGTKKITLIDGLSLDGSYNLAADSFKWSTIATAFRTNIMDLVNISARATFDPYSYNRFSKRRVDTLLLDREGQIARLMQAEIGLSASLRSGMGKNANKTDPRNSPDEDIRRMMQYGRYNDYVDFNIPWNLSLQYSLGISRDQALLPDRDTFIFNNNTVTLSGDFNLTPRWKIVASSGYNFITKQLTPTQLELYRDLHCWEMRLSTIPFGPNKNFIFTLNVKAQMLHDLRLLRRRDFRDAVY